MSEVDDLRAENERLQRKLDCGNATCGMCAVCERLARTELQHIAEARAKEAEAESEAAIGNLENATELLQQERVRAERLTVESKLLKRGRDHLKVRAERLADAVREVVKAIDERTNIHAMLPYLEDALSDSPKPKPCEKCVRLLDLVNRTKGWSDAPVLFVQDRDAVLSLDGGP